MWPLGILYRSAYLYSVPVLFSTSAEALKSVKATKLLNAPVWFPVHSQQL